MTTLGHRINHVKAEGTEFVCDHCGERYAMAMPAPICVFLAASTAFIHEHKYCVAPSREAATHV